MYPEIQPLTLAIFSSLSAPRAAKSVEGINPAESRAKIPLEVTTGGLAPSWGGVRRGRVMGRVSGRESTGLQHVLLRLTQVRQAHVHHKKSKKQAGTFHGTYNTRYMYIRNLYIYILGVYTISRFISTVGNGFHYLCWLLYLSFLLNHPSEQSHDI